MLQVQNLISEENVERFSTRPSRWKRILFRKIPILDWGLKYRLNWLAQDLLAGFTVGLTEIPQGIAYASVAGLAPEYGLYCGFMGCFMYAIFGSCKDVNIGPTAIMALMAKPHIEKLGSAGAVILTFLSGCIIFILGLLHLGFVVEFISYPVVAGFTCAAALNIASSQFKGLFGLKGKADDFIESVKHLIQHIGETQKWDAVLGFSSVVFLVLMTELRRFGSMKSNPNFSANKNRFRKFVWMLSLARNAIIVVFGTALAYILKENGETPFSLIDELGKGLPPFTPPPFHIHGSNGTDFTFANILEQFGSSLAFVPLVAILESVAIAKAFSKGKTLDATQELIALGMSNIMGSFVSSMPVTGSFTRTAVNNASGVRTPFGGVFTGAMVLLALAFLTSTFAFIPKTTLASVVIVSMYYLFEFEAIAILWRTKKLDLIPFTVTFLVALYWGLEYGILIGIGVNLLFVLYLTARPAIVLNKDKLVQLHGDCLFVNPCSTYMMFPCAEYLRETVISETDKGHKMTVIIDGSNIKFFDSTVIKNLQVLLDDLELKNHKLILWNFKNNTLDDLLKMDKRFGKHHRSCTKDELITDNTPRNGLTNDDYVIQ